MKERKLKIIISLMTTAVIGLIAIQLYWIASIMKVQQEKFEASVDEALSDAIDKIELNETKLLTLESLGLDHEGVIVWNDKIKKKVKTKVDPNPNLSFEEFDNFDIDIKSDSNGLISIRQFTKNDTNKNEIVVSNNKFDFTVIAELDSIVNRKAKIVSNVVNQFIVKTLDRPIEERLNKPTIDSILAFQLGQKGIETDYNFGVLKKNKNQFSILKDSIDVEELKTSEFKAQLFPDELFGEPNFLVLYFPNQKSYIIQSVSIMLALSALLIITIIAVFFKTVQMLIRQKKITEIKNDLINNITHEFKTPISTISLACEALNEPQLIESQDKITKYTGLIKEENSRLQLLVDTLLRNAAIEKGEYHLEFEVINIHDEILKVAEKFQDLIENASGNLTLSLRAANSIVWVDKLHLENIITNLIDNAYKYSGDNPEIIVSSENTGRQIKITVEDSGLGIDKNHIKKIFDTFYRVPKGNIHDVKGYGIGLSYVKRMTEAMNGTISVESKLGHGSKFILSFPLNNNE